MEDNITDRQKLEEVITTIKALGEKSKVAFIPKEYIFPWLIIAAICYLVFKLLQLFFGIGYVWLIIALFWFCAAWTLIAGKRSHSFTDEFFSLPGDDWIDLPQIFVSATDESFPKMVAHKFSPVREKISPKVTLTHNPFQKESTHHGNLRVSFSGQDFVSYLRCNEHQEWSASTPFYLLGLHPQQSEADIINYSRSISNALKDIPKGESICLVFGCRSKCDLRKAQLSQSIDLKFPIISTMLESEKLKTEEITRKGIRQEWHHYVLVSWSQKNQELRTNTDTISVFINFFKSFADKYFARYFRNWLGTEKAYQRQIYLKLARDLFNNSYLPWKIRLESKGKLVTSSLNHLQAYNLLASRFNSRQNLTDESKIPQKINVTDVTGKARFRVITNAPHSSKNILSKIIEGEDGISNCPSHDGRRDRLRLKNDLVAVLKLETPPDKIPYGEQLYWVWERMKDPSVHDTDIFLEISPGDIEQSRTNLRRLVRQSTYANKYAAQTGNVMDVDASELSDEAIEAQKRLKLGAQPLLVSFTVHVYRQKEIELDIACQRLVELFAPAKLVREDKVCWRRWLETLPINNSRIQNSTHVFSEPRLTLDTESIRSLLPLLRPRDIHSKGVEFINIEGGYPIYVDLVGQYQRAIITGTTGSGKTVMAFAHIKQALTQEDTACVGFDMSNEGEGTLKPIVEMLGERGAYINLVEQSYNILQPPDLRQHDPITRKRRFKVWLESRKKIIISFALGAYPKGKINPDTISSIATLALNAFITDEEIVRRYNAALEKGWKSPEWQNMPVLEDFLFFCTKDKLDLPEFGLEQSEALDTIVTSIRSKMVDPNIGECISKPTSVSPHARLQFFGLSGLSDDNNAYILSLVAQGACLNASLEFQKSLVIIDECPALFDKPGFTEQVGMQFSLGRKEGVSVILIGQNLEAITQCKNSSQIIRNNNFHFIGRITSEAIPHYAKTLNIPHKQLRTNAGDSFGIDKNLGCSHWKIVYGDNCWDTSYYAGKIELAGLANSRDEKKAREAFFAKHPKTQIGKCNALAEYASSSNL